MKRISNFSIWGIFCGAAFSLLSAFRYFVLYPDMDKAVAYVTIGSVISALSWLYNKQLEHSNTILAIEDYLSDKKEQEKN